MTTAQELLALDIGGTKIAAALVTDTGQILARARLATPQDGPEDALPRIAALISELLAQNGRSPAAIQALGIGIPAVLEPGSDRVIWAPNIPGWRDVALRESLQTALGIPTYVEYDGHTAVLGEWWAGAGRGCDSLVDIIIGTGIGGGMILDGRLLRGRDRLAGAAGWTALTTDAQQPTSRQFGHWEALAAGPGIAARAAAALPGHPASALAAVEPLTAHAVFDAARAGDPLARHIVDETADLIGLGVANIVSVRQPAARHPGRQRRRTGRFTAAARAPRGQHLGAADFCGGRGDRLFDTGHRRGAAGRGVWGAAAAGGRRRTTRANGRYPRPP